MPWVWAAAGIRGLRAYRLRSQRCCVGTSPVLPAVTRSSRLIFRRWPACRSWKETFLQGRIRQGPPCMRWGALPSLAAPSAASCPALLALRAPARARYPCEGPVSRLLARSPGSPPRSCPFPAVKAFLLPPRTPRKSLRSIISGFSAIHMVSTEECGYPHLTVVIHRLIHMSSTSYSA
jgi:hypothetical protein